MENKNFLKFFICFLLFCQFVSSEDIEYTYEEPIDGLQFGNSFAIDKSIILLMVTEDPATGCSLPTIHLRLIDEIGNVTFINVNYTFPSEAICPKLKLDVQLLMYNYLMILHPKLTTTGLKKYGVVINYSGDVISEIFLGNFNASTRISRNQGFINIEKPDVNVVATWKRFGAPDAMTGKVVEGGSGEFKSPNILTYNLMGSLNFKLIDGGIGFLHILKYNGTELNNPNLQYWRIYASFLKVGSDVPTKPALVYQSTNKQLNSIEPPNTCIPTYLGEGYTCIMILNNTVTKIVENQEVTESVRNYYQFVFLTTGAFVRFDIIKQVNFSAFTIVEKLPFGGFIVVNSFKKFDGNFLNDNGIILQSWSFGPEFDHFNQFRYNNSIYGIERQQGQKLNILLKSLPKLINSGSVNPIIISTNPPPNGVVPSTITEITITYDIPVRLSTANISIFQFDDGLLRQTFSGESKWCSTIDNVTVHVQIFNSTFTLPNTTYYVKIENDFVRSYQNGEPLVGVTSKIWTLRTEPSFKKEHHSDPIVAQLQLNKIGSSKFLEVNNKSEYFKNILQEFNAVIPLNSLRLLTDERWVHNPNDLDRVLLSFNIKQADDNTQISSLRIYETMKTLVSLKGYTALSINNYTALIDETAEIQIITNYLEKYRVQIIVLVVIATVLLILYLLARWKNPNGKNFSIFGTVLTLQGFAMHLVFVLLSAKNVPILINPSIIFFALSTIFNYLLAINIFMFELVKNPSFVTWIKRYPASSLIFLLFSAVDIQLLDILLSELGGHSIFSAPLSQRSKKHMFFGTCANIFIKDLPQLVMEIIYYQNVISFDLIPTIALVIGGLVLLNKLIWRSFETLVRFYHQQNNNRNTEDIEEIGLDTIG